MAGTGMREDGGVSRVWTPPRPQYEDVDAKSKEDADENNKDEEESQD